MTRGTSISKIRLQSWLQKSFFLRTDLMG